VIFYRNKNKRDVFKQQQKSFIECFQSLFRVLLKSNVYGMQIVFLKEKMCHESETIVFNFRKLLSTLPNYAELELILLFSVSWGKQVWEG
jgi:hypothetical protein